jgi:hypothetical protein
MQPYYFIFPLLCYMFRLYLTIITQLLIMLAIVFHSGPHKTLCDQLRRCFGAWVRQIVGGLGHLEP